MLGGLGGRPPPADPLLAGAGGGGSGAAGDVRCAFRPGSAHRPLHCGPLSHCCRTGAATTAAASVTATAGSRCARRCLLFHQRLCFRRSITPCRPLPPRLAAPTWPLCLACPPLQRERSSGPPPDLRAGRDGREREREPAWDPPPPFGGAGKRGRYDDRGSPRFGPPGFQPPPERGGGWYDGAPRHFGGGPSGFGRGEAKGASMLAPCRAYCNTV